GPSLAQSWTTSADGKAWTFQLRQGVKFHNGREFVADDVKYSYERVLDPKLGSGGRGYLSAIEQIDVVDKHTVRIITKQPSASLLAGMAGDRWPTLPQRVPQLRPPPVGARPLRLPHRVPPTHIP